MFLVLLAFLIGVIAGMRAFMAPAAVSWAARAGWSPLNGTALACLGFRWTPWILSFAALGEMVIDKLPSTPSRKAPLQFISRVVMGSFSGSAITLAQNGPLWGAVAGALGAVCGTLGGAALRHRLVKAIGGKDLPIALLEDAIAGFGALLVAKQLS